MFNLIKINYFKIGFWFFLYFNKIDGLIYLFILKLNFVLFYRSKLLLVSIIILYVFKKCVGCF